MPDSGANYIPGSSHFILIVNLSERYLWKLCVVTEELEMGTC